MKILLDTHVLLWCAFDDTRLNAVGRRSIGDAELRYVSAASAYEIALKARLGKLPGGQAVIDGWQSLLRNLQAVELPLSVAHMSRAASLAWDHRDPFDRMLVAQAQLEGLTVVTDDRQLREFESVQTLWW